jgi:hypothetical protein
LQKPDLFTDERSLNEYATARVDNLLNRAAICRQDEALAGHDCNHESHLLDLDSSFHAGAATPAVNNTIRDFASIFGILARGTVFGIPIFMASLRSNQRGGEAAFAQGALMMSKA